MDKIRVTLSKGKQEDKKYGRFDVEVQVGKVGSPFSEGPYDQNDCQVMGEASDSPVVYISRPGASDSKGVYICTDVLLEVADMIRNGKAD